MNSIHRHDEEDHGNNRAAQAFNEAENARVDDGDNPQGNHEENGADFLEFGRRDGFLAQLVHQTFKTFACAKIVTEEGAADGKESDERAEVRDDRVVKMVGEIREDGDVFRFGLEEVFRGEGEDAA